MTALEKYDTLEASARLRRALNAPLQDVVISIGKRSLMIYGEADNAGAMYQWDLGAISRRNEDPILGVCFHLGKLRDEELWISHDNIDMIDALDDLSAALFVPEIIPKRSYGRVIGWGIVLAIIAVAIWGVPRGYNRMMSDMLSPEVRLSLTRMMGASFVEDDRFCSSLTARQILSQYTQTLDKPQMDIWVASNQAVPMRISDYAVIIPRSSLERDAIDQFERDVQTAITFAYTTDPIKKAMSTMPLSVQFQFLYSAQLPVSAQNEFTQKILAQSPPQISQPTSPLRITALRDVDWLRLRNACL